MRAILLVAAITLGSGACGAKSTPSTKPDPARSVLPDVPFGELDHDQREQFMEERVVPTMAPIFKNHDAKKYAEFGCTTCHHDDGSHDMPNHELPKLDLAEPSSKGWGKYKPADLEWMKNEVKPAMAKLLRVAEFSPENPKGFGCPDCHTAE
jgi:hypothetical protein